MKHLPPLTTPLLKSAARTTEQTVELPGRGYSSVQIRIDVTVDPGTASITPRLEGYDPAADAWFTLLQGSAIAAVSTTLLTVAEWIADAANVSEQMKAPERTRFVMAVADTESMTYSVMAICHE
jgi:hypothetical protein